MRKYYLLIGTVFCFSFISRTNYFQVPEGWPQPVYDFSKNPLSPDKIALGRELFYEPILSKNNIVSCESCHSPFSSFTHIDHALSHGVFDSIGTRNSPALVNLAWERSFMWDGAINHLDMQPLAPITHPAEMGSTINEVVNKLNASPKYRKLFYAAYGDSLVTGEHFLKAVSQFMLTLVSANAKYDKVMRNELAFTAQEAKGYALFQKNCSSCHTEPLFTNGNFENNGLPADTNLNDTGRMKITGNPSDAMKFKVPTLRNIEFTYPYMHDGRFKKLAEVLNHYTGGIHDSPTLSPQLKKGISLTSNEKVDLISFLLTLSDTEFVFNPNHQYPREL